MKGFTWKERMNRAGQLKTTGKNIGNFARVERLLDIIINKKERMKIQLM